MDAEHEQRIIFELFPGISENLNARLNNTVASECNAPAHPPRALLLSLICLAVAFLADGKIETQGVAK